MDSLTNVDLVISTLAEFKESVSKLNDTISELEENRGSFDSAWNSANANVFISEYTNLIRSLEDAYTSLSSYQAKIDRVVQEFTAFDKTIEYVEGN